MPGMVLSALKLDKNLTNGLIRVRMCKKISIDNIKLYLRYTMNCIGIIRPRIAILMALVYKYYNQTCIPD
jgi:hypothetical protein